MSIDVISRPDFDSAKFNSVLYNNTYYSDVMQDESLLISWQATVLHDTITQHLQKLGVERYPRHLEAGSGPAVHHLFALEKYSDEIHLTDFLPENREEIKKWVDRDPESHNWRPFIRAILEQEGIPPTPTAMQEREDAVRSKIRSYGPLDLKNPTEEMLAYRAPLVTSFFVADSATSNKSTFREMTKNAFGMVEPGGLFVAAYLGECESYAVGDQRVSSANLKREDLEETFSEIGAQNVIISRFETPELDDEGFDHIYTVTATSA